jgi:hypothetical protein
MMIKKVSGQSLCSPLSYWRSLPSDGNPSVTRSGKVRFADNPGVIGWWLESKFRVRPVLRSNSSRFSESGKISPECAVKGRSQCSYPARQGGLSYGLIRLRRVVYSRSTSANAS